MKTLSKSTIIYLVFGLIGLVILSQFVAFEDIQQDVDQSSSVKMDHIPNP